ncbi:MAG: trypsin-like peptidase domain-containing protein [Clostridia bacterium]|nr:trypsin-like peptidase domain-containing protein [Clostridia bacterium]
MIHMNIHGRCLALLLAALMLTGMLAVAETADQDGAEANPSYDIVYSSNNPIPEIAERVRPAIVQLNTKQESWDPQSRVAEVNDIGGGSACYIRKVEGDAPGGYMLTNYHVVKDADAYTALWLDGTETDLELVGYDDGSDIAVLKFSGDAPGGAQPIPMGDSDTLRIGELAIIIGNPGTADEVFFGSVTAGIISGLEREGVNADNFSHSITTIQTDAPINGGNSGGALLNARGELVGIPTLKYMTIYEGMTFCIPISVVRDYIDQIIDNGSVVRPRMGVTVTSIDGPDEAMKRYPPCGAQVYTVEPGTPADKAGLKEKDVITEANGARIKSSQDLVTAVDRCGEGQSMALTVYRYKYDAEGNVTGGFEELHLTLQLQIID